jgi:hypothetical protein
MLFNCAPHSVHSREVAAEINIWPADNNTWNIMTGEDLLLVYGGKQLSLRWLR